MHGLCFYYSQRSNLAVVEVQGIPPSTFSPQARYLEAVIDFLFQALFLKNGYVASIL